MKKLLFLIVTASFALTAPVFAQGKGNGNGKWKKQKAAKQDKRWDRNDDDRYDRDGNWDNRRNDDRNYNTGKYSKNAPRKVRDAFYRDYPNARNVSWTKDRGVWTARFDGGGWFGGSNSVSYAANGQRVGGNNNGTFGRNDRVRTTDRRYETRGTQTGSQKAREVRDKIFRN
jgi:hypothetical protein